MGLQRAEGISRIHVKEKNSQNNSQDVKTIKVPETCPSQPPQMTLPCYFSPHRTSALKDQCFLVKTIMLACVALPSSPVWVKIPSFVPAGIRAGCMASVLVSCVCREAGHLLGYRRVTSQMGAVGAERPQAWHLRLIFRHEWSHSFKTHWIKPAHCYYCV